MANSPGCCASAQYQHASQQHDLRGLGHGDGNGAGTHEHSANRHHDANGELVDDAPGQRSPDRHSNQQRYQAAVHLGAGKVEFLAYRQDEQAEDIDRAANRETGAHQSGANYAPSAIEAEPEG